MKVPATTQAEILKVPDLAKYLRCARITVYRLTEKGNLPGHRLGGQWRFYRDEIDRWLRERRGAEKRLRRRRPL